MSLSSLSVMSSGFFCIRTSLSASCSGHVVWWFRRTVTPFCMVCCMVESHIVQNLHSSNPIRCISLMSTLLASWACGSHFQSHLCHVPSGSSLFSSNPLFSLASPCPLSYMCQATCTAVAIYQIHTRVLFIWFPCFRNKNVELQ